MKAVIIAALAFWSSSALASKGTVSYTISGCDYYVVAAKSGFAVLEWYGGHEFDKGDLIIGKFESYGFHDVFDYTGDQQSHVWVEEYYLSKEEALEKLSDHCS